ncbi:DUF2948 family protein [Candidatus Pelagibacter sp.]|nr:DUF2948 family protein [Candidatus Pelagibacter sp.]
MSKKYLAKILARDLNGLNLISLYCHKSILKVSDIKFLKKNKIFLLSLLRNSIKAKNKNKILSMCKFEFVDQARSKNINQYSLKKNLSLLAIDTIKTKKGFEFNLLFSNNGFITLSSEIIEVTLEDLKEIKNDL